MQIGILITNGGPHTPEKWASACAARLVELAPSLDGAKLIAAQKLQATVAEALVSHHEASRTDVRASLAADPDGHFAAVAHNPGSRMETALAAVLACAKGTPWEAEFAAPANVERMRHAIGQSLVDLAHVERLHYADTNPRNAAASAYRAAYVGEH